MKIFSVLMIAAAVMVAGCTKNTSSPSNSTTTTTTTAPATTTSTTTSTTSTIPLNSFTLSGLVISNATSLPVADAEVEILDSVNAGKTVRTNATGNYSIPGLAPSTFTIRVRAQGFELADRIVTITNANIRLDIGLNVAPITTTTTTTSLFPLNADFFQTPTPCTMTGASATVNCKVDSTASTGDFATLQWDYLGKVVTNNAIINTQVVCSDLSSTQRDDTFQVKLTLTDKAGNTSTVTKGVAMTRSGGACGFP